MKYVRLYLAFLRNNIGRELSFRFNFVVNMLTILLGYFGSLLFYHFLYDNVETLAGWGKYEIYVLFATVWIIDSFFGGVFFFNLIQVPAKVKNYDLDYILLKPVNTVFMLSFRHFNLGLFSGVLFGISLLLYSIHNLPLSFNLFLGLLYLILVFSGVIILYSVFLVMITFSLRFVRVSGLIQMFWSLAEFGKNPHTIYPNPIKYAMLFLIPTIVVYNFPAIVLLDFNCQIFNFGPLFVAVLSLIISIVFGVGSTLFFRKTTRYYYS